jgi:hypothetical protein
MTEQIHSFSTGPYQVLDYTTTQEEDKVVVSLNDDDLGRLPIENLETVEKLREALNHAEESIKDMNRSKETL